MKKKKADKYSEHKLGKNSYYIFIYLQKKHTIMIPRPIDQTQGLYYSPICNGFVLIQISLMNLYSNFTSL